MHRFGLLDGMKLKPRLLLLTALIVVGSAGAAFMVARALAEDMIEEWAQRYALRQVLYQKSHMLQPILREIELAKSLAHAAPIVAWARQPDDPRLHREGLRELEAYRQKFHEHSYFLALAGNRHYYMNNADNAFAGHEWRYTLDPDHPNSRWFYELLRQKRDIQVNVEQDMSQESTNVWINVLVREGDQVLGVTGTGLNLQNFLHDVVQSDEPGVTSLYIDDQGAIQLHPNRALIDYASITKAATEHKTFFALLDQAADQSAVKHALETLRVGERSFITHRVQLGERTHLLGMVALPEIGWYQITLMDLSVMLPLSRFGAMGLVYLVTLLVAMSLLAWSLSRLVLRPLARLNDAMAQVLAGQPVPPELVREGSGEMRDVMRHFSHMAGVMLASRHELEEKVRERTAALERLAQVDPMTGILNRRGMSEHMAAAISRSLLGQGQSLGILWLDVDDFKLINDHHGHAVGDEALKIIAALIRTHLRPHDEVARWGGDEFVAILSWVDAEQLEQVAERIRSAVAAHESLLDAEGQPVHLHLSVGGHILQPGETMATFLHRADQALYRAKAAGRNGYCSS